MNYTLRKYGDPVLKQPATNVAPDEDVAGLVAAMRRILHVHDGLGISAQQVGSTQRVCLMRLRGAPVHEATIAINLRITATSEAKQLSTAEGCLSVMSETGAYFRTNIERHAECTIRYQDLARLDCVEHLTGLDAIIAQHEADHLNGKCIADGTSRQQRRAAYRTTDRRKP